MVRGLRGGRGGRRLGRRPRDSTIGSRGVDIRSTRTGGTRDRCVPTCGPVAISRVGASGSGGGSVTKLGVFTLVVTVAVVLSNIYTINCRVNGDRDASGPQIGIGLTTGPGSDSRLASTRICTGIDSDVMKVVICGRGNDISCTDNMVCDRSNCLVAGSRVCRGVTTPGFGVCARSNERCSTGCITNSAMDSVTILGVSNGNFGTTAFNGSSRLGCNRGIITVNEPGRPASGSDVAGNIVSTMGHHIHAASGCATHLVRASDPVGPNSSNNTLIGVCKRVVNVATSGLISRSRRSMNCTVPDAAVGCVTSRLVGSNGVADHTGLNVACITIGSVVIRLNRCGCIKLHMRSIRGSDSLFGGLRGNSAVVSVGNISMASSSAILSCLRRYHTNSGVAIAFVARDNDARALDTMLETGMDGSDCGTSVGSLARRRAPGGRFGFPRNRWWAIWGHGLWKLTIFCFLSTLGQRFFWWPGYVVGS